MTLSHIVAVSENDVIGASNDLPWDIPEDMQFFRDKTKGRILIMGRKTFESVGHPLPKRLNIVVTKQKDYKSPAENVVIVESIEKAIEVAQTRTAQYGDEIFIIGGGQIYKETIERVDLIYLTRIHKAFEGDTRYPKVPKTFELVEERERHEPVPFTFQTFRKKVTGG